MLLNPISKFCEHFIVPEHFSVHMDFKMFAEIEGLRNITSSEKILPLKYVRIEITKAL